MQIRVIFLFLPVALIAQGILSNGAIGGIISLTGAIQIVDESLVPNSVSEGNWENDDFLRVFSERQNYLLPTSVAIDIATPGTYGRNAGFVPSTQSIGINTAINSHFLHFDPIGAPGNMTRAGSITFDTDILGVIVGVFNGVNVASPNNTLGLSNGILGIPRISYDVSISELYPGGGDQITLSSDRRSLSLLLISGPGSDNVRIITQAVPEPENAFVCMLFVALLILMAQRKHRLHDCSTRLAFQRVL